MFKFENLSLTFYTKSLPSPTWEGIEGRGTKFIPNLFVHPHPHPPPSKGGGDIFWKFQIFLVSFYRVLDLVSG
jgi:hypothetical protein